MGTMANSLPVFLTVSVVGFEVLWLGFLAGREDRLADFAGEFNRVRRRRAVFGFGLGDEHDALWPWGSLEDPEAEFFLLVGFEGATAFHGWHQFIVVLLEGGVGVEGAGGGIVGHQGGAVFPAFQGGGQGGHVEVAFHLVRLVAGDAVHFQDGLDVPDKLHAGLGAEGQSGGPFGSGGDPCFEMVGLRGGQGGFLAGRHHHVIIGGQAGGGVEFAFLRFAGHQPWRRFRRL